MQKVSIYQYYKFGFEYSNILDIDNEVTNSELIDLINDYITFLENQNLKVTINANRQNKLFAYLEVLKSLEPSSLVDQEIHTTIVSILDKTDIALDAEIVDMYAWIPSEKRYSIDKLTININSLFEGNIYENLPDYIKYDIRETGFCLTYDRFTASAFHILRAMENSFRFFAETKLNIQTINEENWFLILKKAEDVMKTMKLKGNEDLIANLHLIRIHYRNETAHFGRQYTSSEAQDLFNYCIKVINQMFSE